MSLEDWRELMCIPPYYFWQWSGERCQPSGQCKNIVTELLYQTPSDMARQDILGALDEAAQILQDYLGYPVVPTWIQEEVPVKRACAIKLRQSHVQAVGAEVLTLLGTADVVIDVPANGACPDTFSATYTLTAQQQIDHADIVPDEVALFISPSSEFSPWRVRHEDNEIRPFFTTGLVGTDIAVQGASWLMGRRDLRQSGSNPGRPFSLWDNNTFDPNWLGGLYPPITGTLFESNYLPTIDVYRRTIDPCAGGKLVYDTSICSCNSRNCGDATADDDHCGCCTDMVFCILNRRQGIVRAAPEDCCTLGCECRCSKPLRYCVSYLAYDCNRDWRPVIADLAAALLCDVCKCELPRVKENQVDLARETLREDGRQISLAESDSPFGTLAGQVSSWKYARRFKQIKAVRM